jgi:hypothetical protein
MAYTTIDDPSAHFQSIRWSGNGAGQRDLTFGGNSDMQPDATMWFRENGVQLRLLTDSSRSWESGNKELIWHGNNTEGDTNAVNTGSYGWLAGHSSLTNGLRTYIGGYANSSNINYYAANWKLNGGTVANNTDGNITSSVQLNSTTKQSIITYTGNGSANQTIGHGLGVTPTWWFVKSRSATGYPLVGSSTELGGTSNYLNFGNYAVNSQISNLWGEAAANTSTIRVGANSNVNANGVTYVAYVFSDMQGFHKHGSYEGNNNANGAYVYLGFKPRAILIKGIDGVASWVWHDSRMGQSTGSGTSSGTDINPATANQVMESASNSMDDYGDIDFLSNGFKVRDTDGRVGGGQTYVYWAWADSPFVTSKGVPATAR